MVIMKKSGKKGFFGAHVKSSAMMVSLLIHALIIVVAFSFVVVKVLVKEEQNFEALKVNRPQMKLKKIQVQVKINKKKLKPKIRKRLVVKMPQRKVPEFKMPEITGVKGGIGGSLEGSGLGGGLGFSMPEINMFGVKSRGEKFFFILDATPSMIIDEMGGIPAYNIIKQELLKIAESLDSTVLFNIVVFDSTKSKVLFPKLVPASAQNVETMKAWLEPLNRVTENMDDKDYGLKTLGPGAHGAVGEIEVDPLQRQVWWMKPALLAMKQQADTVYLLTYQWGNLSHTGEKVKHVGVDQEKKKKYIALARKKHKEENDKRRKNGDPPRVLGSDTALLGAYFPNVGFGGVKTGGGGGLAYNPQIMTKAMTEVRERNRPKTPQLRSGTFKKKKDALSVNVIQFFRKSEGPRDQENLKKFATMNSGKYNALSGLEAIQSSSQTD